MRHDECSETLLLMYLDGEGTPADRVRIQAHLDSCWLCRSRLAALERNLHRIADVMAGPVAHGFPEEKIAAAKSRLNAAIAAERPAKAAPVPVFSRLWRVAWIPATAAAFTGGVIWVANRPPVAPPAKPVEVAVRRSVAVSPVPPVAAVPTVAAPQKPVLQAPMGPSRAELTLLALQVCEAAHVLGFDLGRPLNVRIEDEGVRISGLTAQEESDLRAAVTLPESGATLIAGPEAGIENAEQTLAPQAVSGPDVALDAKLPLHAEIAEIAGGDDKVKAFADRAVRSSEMLNRRVHALRELSLALTEADESLLDEEGRARLSLLAAAHIRAMESQAADLRRQLAGLAGQMDDVSGNAGESWRAIASEWYARYGPVHRAVLDLFTMHPEREIDRTSSLSALTELRSLEASLGWRPALTSRN